MPISLERRTRCKCFAQSQLSPDVHEYVEVVGPQTFLKFFQIKKGFQNSKKGNWMKTVNESFNVLKKKVLLIPLNNHIHFSMYAIWNPETILENVQITEANFNALQEAEEANEKAARLGSKERTEPDILPVPKLVVWRLDGESNSAHDDDFILYFINLIVFMQKLNEAGKKLRTTTGSLSSTIMVSWLESTKVCGEQSSNPEG